MSSAKEKPPDKKPHPNTGRPAYRIPEERKAAARVLYESIPGMSQDDVAKEVGVSLRSVEEWCRKDGWVKAPLLPATGMSQAATLVANQYMRKVEDVAGPELPTTEQKHQAMAEVATDLAVSVRAQLIDKHRREWGAIRSRIYKQLDPKSGMSEGERFEHSKTTKINAETLQILQQNERKAWGIDTSDPDKPAMLVIERD